MTTYKVRAPDGSLIKFEGPDGASDEEILSAAQDFYSQINTQKPEQQPETTAGGVAAAAARGVATPAFFGGLGATLGATAGLAGGPAAPISSSALAALGGGLGLAYGSLGGPVIDVVNSLAGTNFSTPDEVMQAYLTKAGVQVPDTPTERIVQSGASGLADAASGVGIGGALAKGAGAVTRGVGETLKSAPLSQVVGGATGGVASQAVQEEGGGAGAQLAANLAGNILGSKVGARIETPRAPISTPEMQQTLDTAQKYNVPVLTSDVAPPDTFIGKSAQKMGERIPVVGTSGIRASQKESRSEAVSQLLKEYGADIDEDLRPKIVKDLVDKNQAKASKYIGMKKDVINRLSNKGYVPVDNMLSQFDVEIANLSKNNTKESTEAAARLSELKQEAMQQRDLYQLEAFRSQSLSSAFDDTDKIQFSKSAREIGDAAIRRLYEPLRRDMGGFIQKNGERRDLTKWMVANKNLKDEITDLKNKSLKNIINKGDVTPESVDSLLLSKKPSDLQLFYAKLTDEGRANVRASILSKAAKKSEIRNPDGTSQFNADIFNGELKRLDPQIRTFFRGADSKQIDGFSRMLSLTQRAREANLATATGQEVAPVAVAAVLGNWLGPVGAAAAAAGIGVTARVYESAPVRDLMVKLGKTKKGSREEAMIAKRLIASIQDQSRNEEKENK